MLRIFQETLNFATKQIFSASNLDSIPTSFFWFREFFLLFHFLSNPSKQITIICLNKDDLLHRSFIMSQKVGLLENSYCMRALIILKCNETRFKIQVSLDLLLHITNNVHCSIEKRCSKLGRYVSFNEIHVFYCKP